MTTDPEEPTMVGWMAISFVPVITVTCLFSLLVGIFFGLYPTNTASKLNPIEALHYE